MSFLKLAQKCVPGRTCPGHVQDMSRTCTRNVPVLKILGHLQKCPESICPMSFLNFSNLSYVLSQIFLKMCPRPDISPTRPGRVPDVSSKYTCPDHFGTSPNRKSESKFDVTPFLSTPHRKNWKADPYRGSTDRGEGDHDSDLNWLASDNIRQYTNVKNQCYRLPWTWTWSIRYWNSWYHL